MNTDAQQSIENSDLPDLPQPSTYGEQADCYTDGPLWDDDAVRQAQREAITTDRLKRAFNKDWKLVPIKPTDDMIVAFAEQWYAKVRCIDDCQLEDCYAAMIAAAPSPEKE